jgi:hypothetical protein
MRVAMIVMVVRVAAMVVGHRARLPLNRRCHREERSDAAIQGLEGATTPGLLRFARNDGLLLTLSTFSSGSRINIS